MKIVRWRYVLFEVLSSDNVTEQELVSIIWKQIYTINGLIEGSKVGFKLLKYDSVKKRGVARVNGMYLDNFRVVLTTLNMQKKNFHINEILVTGTQASLTRKSKNCRTWLKARDKIDQLKKALV